MRASGAAPQREASWDDNAVLKRQFSALVPAFDPRPGRTNVAATTDLQIPAPGSPSESFVAASFMAGSPVPGRDAERTLSLFLVDPTAPTEDDQHLRLLGPRTVCYSIFCERPFSQGFLWLLSEDESFIVEPIDLGRTDADGAFDDGRLGLAEEEIVFCHRITRPSGLARPWRPRGESCEA